MDTLVESKPESLKSNVRAKAKPVESATATTSKPHTPGVLVVDDDLTVRMMLDMGLRRNGFTVWQAADGQEGLDVYARHSHAIDVVVLDVRMPGLDGPQTLAGLHNLNPQIACCFISGEIGKYTPEDLLALGASHFLKKPFSLAEIPDVLHQLLSGTLRGGN
jgi:CheY-like chemotaxis protein